MGDRLFTAVLAIALLLGLSSCADSGAQIPSHYGTSAGHSTEPTAGQSSTPRPEFDAEVAAEGFSVRLNGLVATAAADVAPEGTGIVMREVALPAEYHELQLSGSPMFDLSLEGGLQPASPVTVKWEVPDGLDPSLIAFVTSDGPGAEWRGLPVVVNEGVATVEMAHLSWGWFVDASNLVQELLDGLLAFLGQTHPAPDGCRRDANRQSVSYSVENSAPALLHACLTISDGQAVVTLASNSPYVFPVRTRERTKVRETSALSAEGIVTLAVARRVVSGFEGYLVPGGNVAVEYQIDDWHDEQHLEVAAGQVSPVLGLIPVAVAGVQMLAGSGAIGSTAEIVECMAALIESATADGMVDAFGVLPGLMGCAVIGASAAAGMVVAIIGSLSGHLTTQLRGIWDTLAGTDQFVVSVVREAPIALVERPPGWAPCPNPDWAVRAEEAVAARCGTQLWVSYGGQPAQGLGIDQETDCGITSDGRVMICADRDYITSSNNDDRNMSVRSMHEVVEYWPSD